MRSFCSHLRGTASFLSQANLVVVVVVVVVVVFTTVMIIAYTVRVLCGLQNTCPRVNSPGKGERQGSARWCLQACPAARVQHRFPEVTADTRVIYHRVEKNVVSCVK